MSHEAPDALPELSGETASSDKQPPRISARLSYLLIGGVALGAIVLMCLTVILLALLQSD